MKKEILAGKTPEEIEQVTTDLGLPKFTAKQIAGWLYGKKVRTIDEMTNLSKAARTALAEHYEVGYSAPSSFLQSSDGTVKYLFDVPGGAVESVYIPDKERATLCISSQVGCKMNCRFCMTGRQGFNGQLSAAGILNQIVSVPESDRLTNVVFMGMGEPLDNPDAVLRVLDILTASWGFGWSPKRITVSTSGLKKPLLRFLTETRCHLAISLHTPFPEERLDMMPVEKANPVSDIISLLKEYDFSGQRRLSFEYILFDGLNDTPRHAGALARLLSGLPCRVNLIRFHTIPDTPYKRGSETNATTFRDILNKKGIICTIRASRGEDILAACGMLSTAASRRNENPVRP